MCGVCLGVSLARAAAASNVPERGAGAEPARVIVLDDALDPAAREQLEQSLRELLARIDVQLADPGASSGAEVVARVSIELSRDAALVSVSSPRDSAAPARYRVERTSEELFRETLAHVILAAVEPQLALLRGPPPPEQRAAAQESSELGLEPIRAATPSFDGRSSWSWGARAGPLLLAADRVGAALGASLVVAFRAPARPAALLEASYQFPVLVRAGDVAAGMWRVGLRARARAEPLTSERLALQLSVGGGLDVIRLAPQSLPPGRSVGEETRWQPLLGGTLGGRWRVADDFDLLAGVGAELELAPRRWWIESGAERQRFFETPRWLPSATLGFEWRLGPASAELPP